MDEEVDTKRGVLSAYQRGASKYDLSVRLFDVFARFGFNISGWRQEAISKLNLKPGDTVVDIGCGTGLNIRLLHQAVGEGGKIIGVDLSHEMLNLARQRAAANGWDNIQLVCIDASQFDFPESVNAVLSTFTLILVPNCGEVVINACRALAPGGRFVVLDMAWPRYCPLWWRHVLFFLRSYGVTADVIRRRPWETVQKEVEEHLMGISRKSFWFGFFYLWSGAVRD